MLVTEQDTDFADLPMNPDGNLYVEAEGAFQDEYTFAGAFRIDFNVYPYALYEIPDSFTWDLKITNIYGPDWTGQPDSPLSLPGEWTFSSQITRQEIDTKTVDVNQYAPNGDGIVSVTITPYEVDVEMGYDEGKVQPGYERFDSIQSVMLDGSGKLIEDNIGLFSPDGYDLSMITVYYMETPDEASWLEIQDKLLDEDFAPQLQEYLEDIAIQNIQQRQNLHSALHFCFPRHNLTALQTFFHINDPLIGRSAEHQPDVFQRFHEPPVHKHIYHGQHLVRMFTSCTAFAEQFSVIEITGIAPDIFLRIPLFHFP